MVVAVVDGVSIGYGMRGDEFPTVVDVEPAVGLFITDRFADKIWGYGILVSSLIKITNSSVLRITGIGEN